MAKSKFFGYLGRLKWIKRWGLKRNTEEENVMEHSWQVATIAHALAIIHNEKVDQAQAVDANRVAVTALYHDVSEIITGDLPTPVKYFSKQIQTAYKEIEIEAEKQLLGLLPEKYRPFYEPLLLHEKVDTRIARFVKAADVISAYLKCQQEVQAGNQEFRSALDDVEKRIRDLTMPEVEEFMATFNESYLLTLDELLNNHDPKTSSI
ncbi:MAG: 5'-deoxynucleotidase [Cellvibrionales bacterium]|nr:5'-deoxynucleotidase [Cellvibrionales bacterium]